MSVVRNGAEGGGRSGDRGPGGGEGRSVHLDAVQGAAMIGRRPKTPVDRNPSGSGPARVKFVSGQPSRVPTDVSRTREAA